MGKNKLLLKLHQRFRSEKQNVFSEKANEIALNTSNDKRVQSIVSIEKCAYGTSKNLD